jgi:hypothetical protein
MALNDLGVCVGYLAQADHWATKLADILTLEYDIGDPEVSRALNCLTHHIPLVREQLIKIMEEVYDDLPTV